MKTLDNLSAVEEQDVLVLVRNKVAVLSWEDAGDESVRDCGTPKLIFSERGATPKQSMLLPRIVVSSLVTFVPLSRISQTTVDSRLPKIIGKSIKLPDIDTFLPDSI